MATYKRMSFSEREEISRQLAAGRSLNTIAQELGRSASTLSRECRRDGRSKMSYRAGLAQREVFTRAHHARRSRKLVNNLRLQEYVHSRLIRRWSPEQIAHRLKLEYPEDTSMRLCHETIYTYLYVLPHGELKAELLRYLRHKPRYRRKRLVTQDDRRGKIPEMISIDQRPAEVADRTVPGHWEGDLVVGASHTSALGTLVERTTRLTLLAPLKKKDAPSVRRAFAQKMRQLPISLARSLTYDQGSEMYEHRLFTQDTKVKVYFAHPHSPWERATNENTNGLVRQFFPKGTDFSGVSVHEIEHAQNLLNGRPRKVLKWRTPSEAFQQLLR